MNNNIRLHAPFNSKWLRNTCTNNSRTIINRATVTWSPTIKRVFIWIPSRMPTIRIPQISRRNQSCDTRSQRGPQYQIVTPRTTSFHTCISLRQFRWSRPRMSQSFKRARGSLTPRRSKATRSPISISTVRSTGNSNSSSHRTTT